MIQGKLGLLFGSLVSLTKNLRINSNRSSRIIFTTLKGKPGAVEMSQWSELNYQHPCGSSQLSITPVSGYLIFFWPPPILHICCAQTYMPAITYIHKIKKYNLKKDRSPRNFIRCLEENETEKEKQNYAI